MLSQKHNTAGERVTGQHSREMKGNAFGEHFSAVVLVMLGGHVCPIGAHDQSWLQWDTDSKPIREGPCAKNAKKFPLG